MADAADRIRVFWQRWGVWILGGVATALLVVVIVLVAGGSDDTGPLADATSTTVVDSSEDGVDAERADDTDAPETTDTSEGSEGTTGPTVPDPGWDPHLRVALEGGTPMAGIEVQWVDHPDEDHYTYAFEWAAGDDSGSDFGELPAGTTTYPREVPCGATVEFALVVWDGGTELGRTATGPVLVSACEVVLPSGLTASPYIGHSVIFDWAPGSGYDRIAWEAGFSGATSGSDTGVIGDIGQTQLTFDASCGVDVDLTLTVLGEDGSVLGEMAHRFPATQCPVVSIVAGPTFTVAAGTGNGRHAYCPPGTSVVGGGFVSAPDTGSLPFPGWIYTSEPHDNGWLAMIGAPPERDLTIRSYALCMTDVTTTGAADSERIDVPAGALRSVVATCPTGTTITGGGFQVNPFGANVLVNAADGNGWRVSVFNERTTAVELSVFPVCVDEAYVDVEVVEVTAGVEDGDVGPGTPISCPAGYVLSGGGFASADAIFEVAYPVLVGGRPAWRVEGLNREYATPGPGVAVEASAVCLSFPP